MVETTRSEWDGESNHSNGRGGLVELQLDASDLTEVVERLRRDRALVGRLCAEDAEDIVGCEVLVPANRIQVVRWC